MIAILILLSAAVPLAIAPKLLFHYDMSPKTILLLLAAAAALVRTGSIQPELGSLWSRRNGRAMLLLAGAQTAWMALATMTSDRPWFSLLGSGWRQFGFVTVLALLTVTILIAGSFCRHREHVFLFLRISAVAGVIASIYGIAQYFDLDPLQPATIYHAQAGDSTIVRPPGTFGHADYFGWWLAITLFCGVALARVTDSLWRAVGIACSICAGIAALLSGTRSGLAAIVAGAIFLAVISRPAVRAKHVPGAAVACLLLAGFYFSPAGARMRARTAWSGEEPAGGARPLLWRDSLRMAAAKPITGYGPETFQSAFGVWQSNELARQYPDFHHESPHNAGLDWLTSQGIPGLLLMFGWVTLAYRAGARALRGGAEFSAPLAAAMVASAVAAQFDALSLSPVLLTLLVLGALIALDPSPGPGADASSLRRAPPALALALSLCMIVMACAFAFADRGFAAFQEKPSLANYETAVHRRLPGPGEDIYCSRILLSACNSVSGITERLDCWRRAEQVAARGTITADDTANAWYNLAYFTASQNDWRGTEMSLRKAVAIYPNWFKPHWALAKLLAQTGNGAKALAEAQRAAFLDANRDPEVAQTARELQTKLR